MKIKKNSMTNPHLLHEKWENCIIIIVNILIVIIFVQQLVGED